MKYEVTRICKNVLQKPNLTIVKPDVIEWSDEGASVSHIDIIEAIDHDGESKEVIVISGEIVVEEK